MFGREVTYVGENSHGTGNSHLVTIVRTATKLHHESSATPAAAEFVTIGCTKSSVGNSTRLVWLIIIPICVL